jgi:hypothetical protein
LKSGWGGWNPILATDGHRGTWNVQKNKQPSTTELAVAAISMKSKDLTL